MAKITHRQVERTTLHKVAQLADVSISTVSLVLAGKATNRRISEDTKARVQKAAEELNYAPNLLTRSLRRGRTHVLSFYSAFRNREAADLYMDTLSAAIELAGGREGYDILVHCDYSRSPREIYEFLNGGLADGLILFAPPASDPLLPMLRRCALPVVLLNGKDPERLLPSVSDDVRTGMQLVADALVERGHHSVAILRPPYDAADADLRINLLTSFLAERGASVSDQMIRASGDDADEVVRRLMSEPRPPTAIFCWHDRLAYKVLESCDRLSIHVPETLSIIGYDGLHWASSQRHIAASVRVDVQALARTAVRLLDQYITGYDGPLREETVPVTFLTGTSLGFSPTMQRINS